MTDQLTGAERIAVERARQQLSRPAGGEGWDAMHDLGHADELARAAAVYALPRQSRSQSWAFKGITFSVDLTKNVWPWLPKWWKPSPNNRIRDLEKAGALIAAAIDDLQSRG